MLIMLGGCMGCPFIHALQVVVRYRRPVPYKGDTVFPGRKKAALSGGRSVKMK